MSNGDQLFVSLEITSAISMNSKKIEGLFLRELFSSIEARDLRYCVLRNYDPLPNSLGGSDLDLAVIPGQREQVAAVVLDVARNYGGRPIVDYTSSGRFIRLLGCHEGSWWGAAIDLFWMMEYRGVEYIPSCDVINRAVDYRGIKVARDDDAAVIALVKELLSNGKTRKTYFPDLAVVYSQGSESSLHLMHYTFEKETISLMGTMLAEGNDQPDAITDLAQQLRRDVFCSHGEQKIEGIVTNMLRRLRRLVKPAGFSIAVLGTDGSGKTTMINRIRPVLERAIHNKLQYEHLRPNWLPALGVVSGKREAGDGSPETNPHGQKPSGLVGSLIRLAYYALDYSVGYWIKVFPFLVKRPHICLFDRYYYDFLIDPRRMRIKLPKWVMRLVLLIIPRPDLILCLGADPEVIYQRKPETSLVEVSRQVDELRELCRFNENAFWVDTGGILEESECQILSLIRGSMGSRFY